MGTAAAPRIDERLRRYIAGAPLRITPAQLTRDVGDLAWQLGLPRPGYEQVRVLLGRCPPRKLTLPGTQTSTGRVILHQIARVVDVLYEYPAPGLEKWYRQLARGP